MTGEKYTINNDHLTVEIAQPGSIYSGTRFDWSGFITQVILDGVNQFCVPESYQEGQGTGGVGLCNEFGNDMAVGYDDARPGDTFPKLGVGLLVRDEKPYQFFKTYQLAKKFPIRVDAKSDQVVFIVDPLEVRGYAIKTTKTISVIGRSLYINYHLENIGQKPVVTNEYCHNFVAVNNHPVGPGYSLEFPFKPRFEESWRQFKPVMPGWMKLLPGSLTDRMLANRFKKMEEIIQIEGMRMKLREIPRSPFYARFLGFEGTDRPQWQLIHTQSGVGLREIDNFNPVRLAVWGTSHVISAEVFIGINLQPGQAVQWVRRYEFFSKGES